MSRPTARISAIALLRVTRPGSETVVEADLAALEPILEMHVGRAGRQVVGDGGEREIVRGDQADGAAIEEAAEAGPAAPTRRSCELVP